MRRDLRLEFGELRPRLESDGSEIIREKGIDLSSEPGPRKFEPSIPLKYVNFWMCPRRCLCIEGNVQIPFSF